MEALAAETQALTALQTQLRTELRELRARREASETTLSERSAELEKVKRREGGAERAGVGAPGGGRRHRRGARGAREQLRWTAHRQGVVREQAAARIVRARRGERNTCQMGERRHRLAGRVGHLGVRPRSRRRAAAAAGKVVGEPRRYRGDRVGRGRAPWGGKPSVWPWRRPATPIRAIGLMRCGRSQICCASHASLRIAFAAGRGRTPVHSWKPSVAVEAAGYADPSEEQLSTLRRALEVDLTDLHGHTRTASILPARLGARLRRIAMADEFGAADVRRKERQGAADHRGASSAPVAGSRPPRPSPSHGTPAQRAAQQGVPRPRARAPGGHRGPAEQDAAAAIRAGRAKVCLGSLVYSCVPAGRCFWLC